MCGAKYTYKPRLREHARLSACSFYTHPAETVRFLGYKSLCTVVIITYMFINYRYYYIQQ